MDITAGNDFLGLSDQKKMYTNVYFLDGYGVTATWNLEWKVRAIENKWTKNK
jgi:hypothetical protein